MMSTSANNLKLQRDVVAAPYSTYRIGGPMDELCQPESLEEAIALLKEVHHRKQKSETPFTVLGWGSNTIIASRGIRGMTMITRKMTWSEQLDDTSFCFGSGVHLAKSAKSALDASLTGGEFMIGIPGTIGGAVRMNAGALGQETCDVVVSVTLYNLDTGATETWTRDELNFRYRKSSIDPARHIVLQAHMRFAPGDHDTIAKVMNDNVQFRKSHHPIDPNGGSVFKNPYEKGSDKAHMSAGWMLDQLGAKTDDPTWQEGGIRVSPLHANFIVNVNNGTSTDILKLMCRMQAKVQEAYGVKLTPENLFIGDATDEERELWKTLTGCYPNHDHH